MVTGANSARDDDDDDHFYVKEQGSIDTELHEKPEMCSQHSCINDPEE